MQYENFLFLIIIVVISCKENSRTEVKPGNDQRGKGAQQEQKAAVSDTIRLNMSERNSVVTSPVTIEGEARGLWFFEGTAPVRL